MWFFKKNLTVNFSLLYKTFFDVISFPSPMSSFEELKAVIISKKSASLKTLDVQYSYS